MTSVDITTPAYDTEHGYGAGPVAPIAKTTLKPLPLRGARLTGGVLGHAQEANGKTSIPEAHNHMNQWEAWDNYRHTAGRVENAPYKSPFYEDGEAAKWLEAVAWEEGRHPESQLSTWLEEYSRLMGAAQDDDGYLNTWTQLGRAGRYERVDELHEIFNMGATIQSAVGQYRATGKTELLDVAIKIADHLAATFGPAPKREQTDGHPVVEMALIELYRTTGEQRYLDLAGFFVQIRGQKLITNPNGWDRSIYLADRIPVRDTVTPEGHAVRAVYFASGATDLAIETGDVELLHQLQQQWQNMANTKMYITGALGSRWEGEAFGDPYELAPDTAYGETCASIAAFQWCWRLLLATGDQRYADLMERELYNVILTGVAKDGGAYFYTNPLQVRDGAEDTQERMNIGGRRQWFQTSCCPTNTMRTLASLQAYLATSDDEGVQVHLYGQSDITAEMPAGRVRFSITTDYPWDGLISIEIHETPADRWTLSLRIPEWADGATLALPNGNTSDVPLGVYQKVTRQWAVGDRVQLVLPLTPRKLRSHHRVDATRGAVALARGPVLYALEQVDQDDDVRVDDLIIGPGAIREETGTGVLDGVPILVADGFAVGDDSPFPNADTKLTMKPTLLRAVPYFLWANREMGPMRVFIPEKLTT